MSKRQRRRREVFARQSNSLARYRHPDDGNFAMCPLCLSLFDEAALSGSDLEVEHAPPAQYGGGTQRCLTHATCNREAGDSFETRTARLNERRDVAIEAAKPAKHFSPAGLSLPSPLPRFLPYSEALALATVSSDERKLELKSAYLIAYATLGHSYILGRGLDQVREMLLVDSDLTDTPICADVAGIDGAKLYAVVEPLACVIVMHPTRHSRLSTRSHAVFLPVPSSPSNFYGQLAVTGKLLLDKLSVLATEYPIPGSRRLPMRWDTDDPSPLRAQDAWQVECGCKPGELTHEPHQIRLSEPQAGWSACVV